MTEKLKKRVDRLVSDHWQYHETLMHSLGFSHHQIKGFGAWYMEIGKHFYKHALEDVRDCVVNVEDLQ